jgi:outer membrane cobalamin receptor
MYYLNYGSNNLKTEKSTSFNIGANSKVFGFKVGLDVFNIITKDLIVSTATSPITWEAMNIKKAISKGIEFAISNDSLFDFIDLKIAYTLQATTRRKRKFCFKRQANCLHS